MRTKSVRSRSISPPVAALGAAILFGSSTPFAKQLVGQVSPVLLAGLLYAGSGIGLILTRLIKDRGWSSPGLVKGDWIWLTLAISCGGVLGPILLMRGLQQMSATTASLLLNLEAVFTALIAWIIFKENTTKRIVLGMFLIVTGGILLSWPNDEATKQSMLGLIYITGACLCWAIDNNLTRKVSAGEPLFIAGSKGLISGIVSIAIALCWELSLPDWLTMSHALFIGFVGYGASFVLFVIALRGLGTGRTSAYFSTAPFIGAIIAILFFHEPTSSAFWIAAALMSIGIWLHLNEHHEHLHTHEALYHHHAHTHDDFHQHTHDFPWDGREPHTHHHYHKNIQHSHPHYPDIHHQHDHINQHSKEKRGKN